MFRLFVNLINEQKEKEEKNIFWRDSKFKDLRYLQSNNVGKIGENFVKQICLTTQISNYFGTDIDADCIINDKLVEIKTAVQGFYGSFQHELAEIPWTAEYLIFVDISPQFIYLTIIKNFNENQYKSGNKCSPYFPTKKITWRKNRGAFKLDTTMKINEKNVSNGYTLKISSITFSEKVGDFIKQMIK